MSINDKDKLLIKKFLTHVPVFKNLSGDHLKLIVDDFTINTVKKGETILLQTDSGTDLYIILKGEVKVNFLNEEGHEFVVTNFKAGDFFGEMSLIDGKERSASVIAEKETTLGVLKRGKFLNALKKDPVIALNLLTSMSERLRQANETIESLAFLDVRERLIKFVMHNGEKDKKDFYRIKKYTHNKLAVRIGASREAVSKVLKDMSSKKAIIDEGGDYLFSPGAYLKGESAR